MKTKAKALYNFLLERPDQYISEEEICQELNEYFPVTKNSTGHTTLNRGIWTAVQFINDSIDDTFEMIVLNNRRRQYKIATVTDLKTYLGREHKLLSKKYKRLKQITYKASLNGVADLTEYDASEELKTLNTLLSNKGELNANRSN